MKKAIILVGAHHTGKSLTINGHLKPLLGLGPNDHQFELNGQWGFIWSQTGEESGANVVARIKVKITLEYEILVLAARPETEDGSQFRAVFDMLLKESFDVRKLEIQNTGQAEEKAKVIFNFINSSGG